MKFATFKNTGEPVKIVAENICDDPDIVRIFWKDGHVSTTFKTDFDSPQSDVDADLFRTGSGLTYGSIVQTESVAGIVVGWTADHLRVLYLTGRQGTKYTWDIKSFPKQRFFALLRHHVLVPHGVNEYLSPQEFTHAAEHELWLRTRRDAKALFNWMMGTKATQEREEFERTARIIAYADKLEGTMGTTTADYFMVVPAQEAVEAAQAVLTEYCGTNDLCLLYRLHSELEAQHLAHLIRQEAAQRGIRLTRTNWRMWDTGYRIVLSSSVPRRLTDPSEDGMTPQELANSTGLAYELILLIRARLVRNVTQEEAELLAQGLHDSVTGITK